MAILQDLLLRLRADSGEFTRGLNKASKSTNKFKSQTTAALSGVTKAFGALGIAMSGVAFTRFIAQTFDAMDNLGKMSDRLGVTTEALSSLRHAANLGGISVTEMDNALKFMLKNTSDAAMGIGEAKIAFEALGMSAQAIKNMEPGEAFATILDEIKKLPNAADRANAAMKVFGRAGLQVLTLSGPAIREAREEAEKFGIAIDRDMARKAEDANDAITRMQASIQGAGYQITANLAPAVERWADVITDSEFQSGMVKTVEMMGELASAALDVADAYLKILDRVETWSKAYAKGDITFYEWVFGDAQDVANYKANQGPGGIIGFGTNMTEASTNPMNMPGVGPQLPAGGDGGSVGVGEGEPSSLPMEGFNTYGPGAWEQEAQAKADQQALELEAMIEFNETKYAAEIEQGERMKDLWLTNIDERVAAEERGADMIEQREQALVDYKKQANASMANNAIGFLNMLGQKNKAAAIAGIVIQKGIALSSAYTSTLAGANLAYASQLIPGDPTSIGRAEAAKTWTMTQGFANMALIAASGFMQEASAGKGAGGGGSSGSGTFTNPIITQDQDQNLPDVTSTQSRSISITIMGNVIGQDKYVREQLVPSIAKALNDGKTLEYA